ncbi:MAG: hypothetical protein JWP52_2162 [Rhizobacter sp.]|nr:hypothetical protein [Rhizobacter sp.]
MDDGLHPGILLLDDDPFMLSLQSSMLSCMGYPLVKSAGSAQAALAMIEREPHAFDVIVCDLNMPDMDGIEFLQILSAGSFDGSVILLSGEGVRVMHTVQKLLHGTRLVILGALEKPAGPAALRGLLDGRHPLREPLQTAAPPVFTADELHIANQERQWVLHYQPKVSLATGALAGMEALVRWNHPVHGLVHPDHFISLAEDSGEIEDMTDWVMGAAMKRLAVWLREEMRIHMAINVSMHSLQNPGFAQRVSLHARDAGVAARDVTLEVTESRLMASFAVPLASLVRLRLQRFGLSIDDFGTGHSSLEQLRDAPFTELKVDRGFVNGARHNPVVRPLLESSIGIAKRLSMRSVAEGVEAEDDWHLLRELRCDLAQGHFIGPPMEAGQVPQWLALWQERRPALVAS